MRVRGLVGEAPGYRVPPCGQVTKVSSCLVVNSYSKVLLAEVEGCYCYPCWEIAADRFPIM